MGRLLFIVLVLWASTAEAESSFVRPDPVIYSLDKGAAPTLTIDKPYMKGSIRTPNLLIGKPNPQRPKNIRPPEDNAIPETTPGEPDENLDEKVVSAPGPTVAPVTSPRASNPAAPAAPTSKSHMSIADYLEAEED